MSNLGFKQLSTENWLVPDSTVQLWGRFGADGNIHDISGEEWLNDILQSKLNEAVPLEIKKLFEVARGAMAYGYYFYPLYTLGIEQLLRVVEAAVAFKCKAMGAPSSQNYEGKISWLIKKGAISQSESLRWEAIRKLRNSASHPQMQSIHMPVEALKFLESTANHINLLFSRA